MPDLYKFGVRGKLYIINTFTLLEQITLCFAIKVERVINLVCLKVSQVESRATRFIVVNLEYYV